MRRAFVRISVIPGSVSAQCHYSNVDLPHLVSAAEELERYGRRPVDHIVHTGVSEVEGQSFDHDAQVALILFQDDEYEFKLYNRKLKPFHAFGAAAFLRQHASRQFIGECVIQAMQAMAQTAANGGQQVGPKGLILPGR